MAGGNAEQGAERGVPGPAAVEAEDELVEIGLQMLAAQAVVDTSAQTLRLEKMRCTQGKTMWAAILPTTWGSCLTLGAPG